MPTIEASKKDLLRLIGKKLDNKELEEILFKVKAEIEDNGDTIKIEIADVNRPDLLSIEGIARQCRFILGLEKGLKKYKVKKTNYKIIAKSRVRPAIVSAVIKNIKFDNETIKQTIQLQEKLCEIFGKKRREAAIGIYDFDKIKWPIMYIDVKPEKIRFIPLEMKKEMSGKDILKKHPTGIKYASLLKNEKKYPLLIDSSNNVLSMPPIINSNYSGKITEKTTNVFIEVTGYNYNFLIPVLNTIVTALADRGGKIESVKINKIITPNLTTTKYELNINEVNSVLGTNLKEKEIIDLLKRYGYDAKGKNKLKVEVPFYRSDVLDTRDIIEDIAIVYDYNNIKLSKPNIISDGKENDIEIFSRKICYILIGLGFQEVATNILTNKDIIKKARIKDYNIIEIENPISEHYSIIRPLILPPLLQFLSKNKTSAYPQKIFEIGNVINNSTENTNLAIISTHKNVNFTEIKQILDYLMNQLGVNYNIEEDSKEMYIEGRCGKIIVKGKEIGNIGEVNPKIITSFDLEFPIASLEINISKLFKLIKD